MKKTLLLFAGGIFLFSSCGEPELKEVPILQESKKPEVTFPEGLSSRDRAAGRVEDQLKANLNSTLFASSNYKVSEVHVCMLKSVNASTSVETVDQQFQSTLSSRWVTNDDRRNWNGDNDLNDIDWLAFPPFAVANNTFDARPIYQRMYNKWETGGSCKTLNIDQTAYATSMGNPSLILGIGGLPPADAPLADISLIGFLPASIFNAIFGSPNVLGVAFSFVFINPETGEPIKTTRGKEDKAFTEVWFNNGFSWAIGAAPGKIDLESVILHEFGHTLNLGHFGILQAFTTKGTTRYVYQPVNTMNAIYIGEPRNFLGQNDKGNYCEAWGSWPWN